MVINAQSVIDDLTKYSRFGSRKWFIPNAIFNSRFELKRAWLRAYFDGDGSVDISKKSIFAKSVNKLGLEQITLLLETLYIKSHILGPYDDAYVLVIDSKDVYSSKIRFLSSEKSAKLDKITNLDRG